jgi:hypothetical protein
MGEAAPYTAETKKNFVWNMASVQTLIELRHDPDMDALFRKNRSNARKIKELWQSIAVDLGGRFEVSITGQRTKEEYNYLLKEFCRHSLKARESGEGAVRWQVYNLLKTTFTKDPSVSPAATLDTGLQGDVSDPSISSTVSMDGGAGTSSPPAGSKRSSRDDFQDQVSLRKLELIERLVAQVESASPRDSDGTGNMKALRGKVGRMGSQLTRLAGDMQGLKANMQSVVHHLGLLSRGQMQ